MRQKLPYLRIPIVRYYSVQLHIHNQIHSAFNGNVVATFAQTEYSQLLLAELSLDGSHDTKTPTRIREKTHLHTEDFDTSDKFTIDLDDRSYLEIRILEYRSLASDVVLADLSEELIECFELLYLFLKGVIFPGIHKLQMLIDSGLAAVVPLRELLSRVLSDKLKVNILAEYQLMNFDDKPDDFIDFNLIWFLGKMDLPSVEKFMQEEEIRLDEEGGEGNSAESDEEEEDEEIGSSSFELPESSDAFMGSSGENMSEYDRQIKTEFENELKKFYLDEPRFFTRVVGIRHYTVDMTALGEGTRVMLTPEPDNPHDLYAVAVRTKGGEMIGYLKKELSAIMYPEIRKGILFRATVVKVLPEIVDSNSRVHLMIEKIMYHFN